MKRLITVSAMVLLALLVVAGPALAQAERPRAQRARPAGDRMRGQQPGLDVARFRQLVAQLDLTGEQKEKIAALAKEFEKKAAEQSKETAEKAEELREKLNKAREDGDSELLAELRQKSRQLRVAQGEMDKEFVESVKKVLTEEQKKKLEELQKPVPGIPMLLQVINEKSEELKVTEEQQEKIKALAEEFKPAEGEDQRSDGRALQEKTRKMREDGASQEEIRKVYQEAQKKQAEQRAKMEKRSGEFVAKLAKILKEDQMKQVMAAARTKMTEQRGRRREGAGANARPRRDRPANEEEKEEEKKDEDD